MKKFKSFLTVIMVLMLVAMVFSGCQRQSEVVSHNLSLEADSFNVTRQLTIINTRAEDGNAAILYQMTGNFSIDVDEDNDLNIIGENPGKLYYKHFVHLSRDITYIVQDLGASAVDRHQFVINFNPKMIVPVQPGIVD